MRLKAGSAGCNVAVCACNQIIKYNIMLSLSLSLSLSCSYLHRRAPALLNIITFKATEPLFDNGLG